MVDAATDAEVHGHSEYLAINRQELVVRIVLDEVLESENICEGHETRVGRHSATVGVRANGWPPGSSAVKGTRNLTGNRGLRDPLPGPFARKLQI